MKTKLMGVVALAAAMFAGTLYAMDPMFTEKVDGLTWEYQIEGGKANVYRVHNLYGGAPTGAVTIPAKLGGKPVAVIGEGLFSWYDGVTSVTIPSTVTRIEENAFSNCDALTSVKIPDSVTTIGEYAFAECDSLKCVDFGKKVEDIGECAFYECYDLRSLVFRGNAPGTVGADAFYEIPSECKVYVAKSAKGWPAGQWQERDIVVGDCMATVYVDYRYEAMKTMGTITEISDGRVAVGKKITLKATPNKGCVFGGWIDFTSGTEQFLGYSQSLSYTVAGDYVDIYACFYTADEDVKNLSVYVDNYYSDEGGYVWIPTDSDYLHVYTCSEPKFTFKGLPAGVKYDAKKFALEGTAKTPGRYKVQVSATNKSVKKATEKSTAEFTISVPNIIDDLITVDDWYGEYVPGVYVVETIPEADGCKVTGLPTGMKWTAKAIVDSKTKVVTVPANSAYGTPTKPGDYTVFFTKTVDKVKHTATSTFIVDPLRKLAIVTDGKGTGKVTGAGAYAANAKVKLTAKADSGSVFGGWFDEDGELLSLASSYTYPMADVDTTLTAKFVTLAEDADPKNIEVIGEDVVDDTSEVLMPGEGNYADFHCGVYVNWHLGIKALSQTTVKVSKLPAGLKFTAKDIVDSKTKEVTVKANSIYGVPTKYGENNVTITVTTAGKASFVYNVFMIVRTLDAWAYGQFEGGLVNMKTEVGGIASVTVTETGKISGKYICQDGKTWTISAPHFDYYEYDDEEEVGAYYATLTFKSGKEEVVQDMMVWDPKEYTIGEPCLGISGDLCNGELLPTFWKAEIWKDVGKKINKTQLYVDLDPGTIDMTFSANGSVKVALNYFGYKATCTTTLIPVEMPDPDKNGSFNATLVACFPANPSKGWPGAADSFDLKWDGSKFEVDEDE